MNKISIRFFDDKEVRAVWDEEKSKWWFSVLDIIGVLRGVDDYEKNRNYWKYLKAKLKREENQLGSVTTQFKFTAPDGKKRAANVLDYTGIIELAKNFPSKQANRFIAWTTAITQFQTYMLVNLSLLKYIHPRSIVIITARE